VRGYEPRPRAPRPADPVARGGPERVHRLISGGASPFRCSIIETSRDDALSLSKARGGVAGE